MEMKRDVITKRFLKFAFESYFNKKLEILAFSLADVSEGGENYFSDMKRIRFTYQFENESKICTLTAIAKYMPQNELLAQSVTEMKFFDCELEMYGSVIPQLSTLAQLGKVAPEVYYSSAGPLPILLLEDLSASNYKILERRNGLVLSQCLLAVEKLAHFHAASFVLYEKDPSTLMKFNKSVFGRQGLVNNLLSTSYNEVIKLCEKVPELNRYVEKMKSSQERILGGIGNVHNMNSKLKVLNHGDFWINNMLFLYDQHGNEEDVLFIDFQTPCFSSPCLDLHYFLAGNLSYITRCKQDAIIDHYFHTLKKGLNKLCVNTLPNRNDFDEDFRLMSCYGFGASILSLALIRSNPSENSSLHNFLEDNTSNGFRYHCFNSEEYLKEVLHYLPFYDKLGLFDTRE